MSREDFRKLIKASRFNISKNNIRKKNKVLKENNKFEDACSNENLEIDGMNHHIVYFSDDNIIINSNNNVDLSNSNSFTINDNFENNTAFSSNNNIIDINLEENNTCRFNKNKQDSFESNTNEHKDYNSLSKGDLNDFFNSLTITSNNFSKEDHQSRLDSDLDYNCKTVLINNTCSTDNDLSFTSSSSIDDFIEEYSDHNLQHKINKTLVDITLDYFLPESNHNTSRLDDSSIFDDDYSIDHEIDILEDHCDKLRLELESFDLEISQIDNLEDEEDYNSNNNLILGDKDNFDSVLESDNYINIPTRKWGDILDIKDDITSDDLIPDPLDLETSVDISCLTNAPYPPVDETSIGITCFTNVPYPPVDETSIETTSYTLKPDPLVSIDNIDYHVSLLEEFNSNYEVYSEYFLMDISNSSDVLGRFYSKYVRLFRKHLQSEIFHNNNNFDFKNSNNYKIILEDLKYF